MHRYLSGVLRMKAHTLTANEEKLMAMASDACNAASNAYEMLSYADMNLGMTRGENGEKVQLTDARLLSLLASKDRAVRKAAYTNIMNGYNKFGNTIAATYAGLSGTIKDRFPSASSAHRIMPSDTTPANLAGFKLVTTITFFPTISSGE